MIWHFIVPSPSTALVSIVEENKNIAIQVSRHLLSQTTAATKSAN